MPLEDEGSLLVTIIDTNPCASLLQNEEGIVSRFLDAATVFCNSHLMLNPCNRLAVIACHSHKSTFLYPKALPSTQDTVSVDGQYELFGEVTNAIKEGIKELVASDKSESQVSETLLTGGLSLALCYINRIEKETAGQKKIASRIMVLSASGESASQYLNFMNVFFTAQKKNVIIDACVLEKDSGLLQQGCDITGGKYMKVPNHTGLLQYLLLHTKECPLKNVLSIDNFYSWQPAAFLMRLQWLFLPDKSTRDYLVFPPPVHVDYRAACFCHRNLIEIGYVCSVCLSIFCAFSPICSTCQTAFKFTGPLPSLLKGKKKKQKLGI